MQRFYRRSIIVRPLMTVMLALLFSACATGPIQPVWAPAVSSSEDPGRFNTDLAERRESAVEPDAPLAGIHGDDSYQFLLPIRQNNTFNTLVPATPG
ncbi:hypothetical protein BH20PSE1_BH20PSE1_20300 [soil metagenome]